MGKKIIVFVIVIVIIIAIGQSCNSYNNYLFRSNYEDANALLHHTAYLKTKPFLKAHLINGDVSILNDTWKIDTTLNFVRGYGTRFNFNRNLIHQGTIDIPIDSVAIFETNAKLQNTEDGRVAALGILAGLDVIVGIICATNPKACFGSCPTFYINEHDNFHDADAEGFSNAISPSMENFDIDALNKIKTSDGVFSITMRNEALETHCIKKEKLLVYPVVAGERVYQSSVNDFYLCENNYELTCANAREGDVTALLRKQDRVERFSLADDSNLASKEEIFMTFDNVTERSHLGLILNFRQTLMTTYFIYSAMGYMGDEVGDIFAKMETNTSTKNKLENGIKKTLGDIEVYLWSEQNREWVYQNSFYETGPIAINRQFTPLQDLQRSSKIEIKLVLNKGLWRIDYASLTNIKDCVTPVEINPTAIFRNGTRDDLALRAMRLSNKHLISMPGSNYRFDFELPEANTDYELFLWSEGYYLEWMRAHWIKDKDLLKLNQMVNNPQKYLEEESRNYKQYELTMEREFWTSKVESKVF